MSFWSVDDKIPVRQTNVSVFAEHGLEYKSSQKINFHIPPTISYFQPRECYLEFDVQILQNNDVGDQKPCRMTLDATFREGPKLNRSSCSSAKTGCVARRRCSLSV